MVTAEDFVHVPQRAAVVFVAVVRALLRCGCDVVVPTTPALLGAPAFRKGIMDVASIRKGSVAFAAQDDSNADSSAGMCARLHSRSHLCSS